MFATKGLLISVILLLGFQVKAQQTVSLFYEKVYIHTDKDNYTSGESIWFKAYLANAKDGKLINYSKNIYVELISPGLKVVSRITIRMENGLGNGDFNLKDTLSAGVYRIRAYTNYMRNFGDQFIFDKNIAIASLTGKQPNMATTKRLTYSKSTASLIGKKDTLPRGAIVRFFPEGGALINDVRSQVAVKAEDEKGRGIAVSGNVIASSGRVVAKFSCDSLGMGLFNLEPDQTQDYHAEVMINNELKKFDLRSALYKGFMLSVNTAPGFIIASVATNGLTLVSTGSTDLVIVAQHAGKIIHKQRITINSKVGFIQIPDTNFPEGVACVTLYDEFAKPLSERLVYVHHSVNSQLTLTTDKPIYASKEKVTVNIKLSDTTQAYLSFAAVDAAMAPVEPQNILSYLTLTSEVKGTIIHPERYFDTHNANRFKELDLLLLTQGWRDFIWEQLPPGIAKLKYEVEQSIPITGHVRSIWKNQPLSSMNITMFASGAKGQKLFATVTDSTGSFAVNGALLYGYQYVNFTSRKSGQFNDDGSAKGRSGGWIQVDSLNQDIAPITERLNNNVLDNTSDSLLANAKRRFTFTGVNELKAVQIKDNSPVLAPLIQHVTLVEQKEYDSLLNYLLDKIPGSYTAERKNKRVLMFNRFDPDCIYQIPIVPAYSDKSRIDAATQAESDYLGLSMSDILDITIYRQMFICGIFYSVKIVLRPGALKVKDYFQNTMADITGYYKARVFYTPSYEAPNDKPDYRTTIHWEPNITTNAHGEATLTYYNSDPKTKVRLIVQGITDKGIPVVALGGYEVK